MQLQRFDRVEEFWHRARTYIADYAAENNVLLSVIHTLLQNPERYPGQPYLAIVEKEGKIVAAALQIPHRHVLLSKSMDLGGAIAILKDIPHPEKLPGALGLGAEVRAFAEAWQLMTGDAYRLSIAMTIYQLRELSPVPHVPGNLKLVRENDRPILIEWLSAFSSEIGEYASEDVKREADSRLNSENTYFWEDGVPVSLISCQQVLATVGRINLAYTPPKYRRQGYASAGVAALSQQLLDKGCQKCFLLADVANGTANRIYQAMGYRAIGEWYEYSFGLGDFL